MVIPPPILSAAELDVTAVTPPACMCVPPPPPPPAASDSELLELVRHDIVYACVSSGKKSATLLAKRAPLSDDAAWMAVYWDLNMRSRLADAADFLSEGRVQDAAKVCAKICGMELDEWVKETRRELALKAVR